MSFFFGAGLIGLGYLVYENKQSIGYKILKTYTYLQEQYNTRFNPKDSLNVSYFLYNEKNKTLKQSISSNHNLSIFNVNDKNIFLYNPKNIIDDEYNKEFNDIKQNSKEYVEEKIPLIAMSTTIYYEDNNEKKILVEEHDVSKLIKSFLYGGRTLNISKKDKNFWLLLINKYNNININKLKDYTIEWILLDNDLNMTKCQDMTLSVSENKLIIKV